YLSGSRTLYGHRASLVVPAKNIPSLKSFAETYKNTYRHKSFAFPPKNSCSDQSLVLQSQNVLRYKSLVSEPKILHSHLCWVIICILSNLWYQKQRIWIARVVWCQNQLSYIATVLWHSDAAQPPVMQSSLGQ